MTQSGNTLRLLKQVAQACGVQQKIKVLLVDDSPAMQLLIPAALERFHPNRYETEVARSVSEAIELLINGRTFDVCLMDYNLGEARTGSDIIKVCEDQGVEIPFIMITAMSEGDIIVREALKRHNCMGFLPKSDLKLLDDAIQFAIRNFAKICIARRQEQKYGNRDTIHTKKDSMGASDVLETGDLQMCWQSFIGARAFHCRFSEWERMVQLQ